MKKKIILAHFITLFLSFVLMFFLIFFSIDQINRTNTETNLRNNLAISEQVFLDQTKDLSINESMAKTSSIVANDQTNIRITFISKDGYVLFDNENESMDENHLTRPEIQNVGKIYYRHSASLNLDMTYLASYIDSFALYIRIALPIKSVNTILNKFILYASIIIVAIFVVALFLDYFFIDRELKPLKRESEKLAKIVSYDNINDENEIESISESIKKTEMLIKEKVDDLTDEKEKLNYIIDSMNQGVIILDDDENILLINSFAKNLFHSNGATTLTTLTILPEIHDVYLSSLDKESSIIFKIEERTMLISAHPITDVWVKENEKGSSILLVDISEEQRLESAKKDFFANASHELKSPLTSILGYTQMIKEGFLTYKKDVDDALSKIQSEGKRMNEIIIAMLELSRLESETKPKSNDYTPLNEVIHEELLQFDTEINRKGIMVSFYGESFSVKMSKEDLSSLIKNLFENAIRYNKDNGKVSLSFDKEKKSLSISDTGIGIPKEDLDRIFERFFRVDKARSRKLGGTGLGLSIVKHICSNNNVQIKVESLLDKGSTFTLFFSDIQ